LTKIQGKRQQPEPILFPHHESNTSYGMGSMWKQHTAQISGADSGYKHRAGCHHQKVFTPNAGLDFLALMHPIRLKSP